MRREVDLSVRVIAVGCFRSCWSTWTFPAQPSPAFTDNKYEMSSLLMPAMFQKKKVSRTKLQLKEQINKAFFKAKHFI